MTDRERLIELLSSNICVCDCSVCDYSDDNDQCIDFMKSRLADLLIENGVIFASPSDTAD